jgi:hypothetical protein
LSDAARGIPPPVNDPVRAALHGGISVFSTEQQARNKARDYPFLGAYIARLEIPAEAPIRVERTLSTRGHHTIWGDADQLLHYVVAVVPV